MRKKKLCFRCCNCQKDRSDVKERGVIEDLWCERCWLTRQMEQQRLFALCHQHDAAEKLKLAGACFAKASEHEDALSRLPKEPPHDA